MDLRLSVQTPFARRSFDLKTVDNWSTIQINTEGITPQARYGHTLHLLNDQMLVFGGRSEDGYLNDLFTFDLISHTWKKFIPKTKITKRCLHSSVGTLDNDLLIIFGGHHQDEFLNDVYYLKTKTFEIEKVEASGDIPSGRQGHSAVVRDNIMYIFGGLGVDGWNNHFYSYHILTKTWKKLTFPDPPPARHLHSAIMYQDKMIIFGGRNDNYLNDIYEFDFDTEIWSKIEDHGDNPSPRYGFTSVLIFGTMLVSGGYSDRGYLNEVYSFDLELYKWTKIKTGAERPKIYHHRSIIHTDYMYVFGGHNGSYLNELYRLDLSQEQHQAYGIPNLISLYENQIYPDLVLAISGNEYHLHKCIVSQCQILDNSPQILENIDIKSTKPFDLLFRFLYGQKIMIKTPDILISLMMIAQVLKLNELDDVCIHHFGKLVTNLNVVEMLRASEKHSLSSLHDVCMAYIVRNKEKFDEKSLIGVKIEPFKPIVKTHLGNRLLQSHVEKLFDNKHLADLTLVTDDGSTLLVHRSLLMAFSEYLKKMLSSGFQESFEKQIVIPEIPFKILNLMIEFSYCKSVGFPTNITDLIALVHYSDIFMFKELYHRATNELKKLITVETALEIVNQCVKYQIEGVVKENCWKVIKVSGVKDQLVECLFEMHLSTMQGTLIEHQKIKEIEESLNVTKSQLKSENAQLKSDVEFLKQENADLKKLVMYQKEMFETLLEKLNKK